MNRVNTTVLNSTIINGQNMTKKFNETASIHNQKSIDDRETSMAQKHYFYNGNVNKDSKVTIKGREKSGLMDFTAQLNTQEC